MPSIEIICVRQESPTDFTRLPFPVIAERDLVSHRTPSLFQMDFDTMRGCIYHLGNPSSGNDAEGFFFAHRLLSEKCRDQERNRFLEFDSQYIPAVRWLLQELLKASPAGRIIFTSDWQFGPRRTGRFDPIGSGQFWKLHDAFKLRLNALYPLRESLL